MGSEMCIRDRIASRSGTLVITSSANSWRPMSDSARASIRRRWLRISEERSAVRVARIIASIDTLDGFLRDLRTRYPEINSYSGAPPSAAADPKKPDVKSSARPDTKPDTQPTGSIRTRAPAMRTTSR